MRITPLLPNARGLLREAHSAMVGIGALLLLSPTLWGCKAPPSPRLASLPSEKLREDIGTVAIVSARFKPKGGFQTRYRGRPESISKGAAGGAAHGAVAGLGAAAECGPFFFACLVFTVGGGLIVGGTVGGVYAGTKAVPEKTAKRIESRIHNVLLSKKMQALMHESTVEAAKRLTSYKIVSDFEAGPASPEDRPDYSQFASRDVDAVLEVNLRSVGFHGRGGGDPALRLFLVANVRLIRVPKNVEVYKRRVLHVGAPRKFTEWGANNAAALDSELTRASSMIAEQLVEEVFLLHRSPKPPTIWEDIFG